MIVNQRKPFLFLASGILVASIAQLGLFSRLCIVNRPTPTNSFYLVHRADMPLALGGVLLYVLGMALVLGGFRLASATGGVTRLATDIPSSAPRSARCTAAIYGIALVALLLNLGALWYFIGSRANRGLLFWFGSLLLFILACWLGDHSRHTVKSSSRLHVPSRSAARGHVLLALVILVGIGFRFYRLATIPPGLNDDAAWNGLYAIELVQDAAYTPYSRPIVPGGAGRETMFHYVIAALMTMTGRIPLAIKAASAIIGVLHLIASYLLARELFGRRAALMATMLLATSGWHITMSKIGWRDISMPFFETLCFYFLWRGFRTGRYLDFALSGLALGLTLNTYPASYVTPCIVLLVLLQRLHRLIGRRTSPSLAGIPLRRWSVVAILAVLTLTPLLGYAAQHGDTFTQRTSLLFLGTRIARAGNLEPVWRSLAAAAGLFNLYGNGDDLFTTRPLLDFPSSVFFVLGLGYCLLRWRDTRCFLLLVWLGGALGLGVLSIPNGNRCIGAITPVYLMGGIFLERLARLASAAKSSDRNYRYVVMGCVVGVLLAIGLYTYHDYIGPDRRYLFGFGEDEVYVGAYINKLLQEGYQVYLAEYYYDKYTVRFVTQRSDATPSMRPCAFLDEETLQRPDLMAAPRVALLLRPPDYLVHREYRIEGLVNDTALSALIAARYPEVSPTLVRPSPDPAHVILHAYLFEAHGSQLSQVPKQHPWDQESIRNEAPSLRQPYAEQGPSRIP